MPSFEDKISLLLPAYLNGTLSIEEKKQVEEAVERYPEIAADLAFQKQLKHAVKTNIENAHMPGELGWAKLSKAMKEAQPITDDNAGITDKPKFWRYAASVLAIAAVGQAGVIGSYLLDEKETQQYVTVSESVVAQNSFKLAFNGEATESDIRYVLLETEGNIVNGPSKLGFYDVVFTSKAACDAAFEIMESQNEIIKAVSVCS